MTGTRRNCVANLNKALTCAITKGGLQARYPGCRPHAEWSPGDRYGSLAARRDTMAGETPPGLPATACARFGDQAPGDPPGGCGRQDGITAARREISGRPPTSAPPLSRV
jgi:hypothetical protein